MALIDDIRAYSSFNQQETVDRRVILHQLANSPHVFDRTALAHMTCSAWTVNPAKTRVLMVHHNLYNSWSWIGGHADGEENLANVALRELREETGIEHARLVPCGPGNLFSLEVLTVNGHEKRGSYVSAHLHLNITYLAVASPDAPLRVQPNENTGVRWFDLNDALAASTEPWMVERVYRKLIAKLAVTNLR